MKYAIVKTGSVQQKVAEGDKIKILGTTTKPSFEVMFFADGDKVLTDAASLKNVKISARVLGHARTRKLVVGRYKSKSRYDKQTGFRAEYTNVLISSINHGDKAEEHTVEVVEKSKSKTKSETVAKKSVKSAAVKEKAVTKSVKKLPAKEKSAKAKK